MKLASLLQQCPILIQIKPDLDAEEQLYPSFLRRFLVMADD